MPIVVGIAGKGDVVAIFELDEPLHGMGRGGIHANLAIPIERHESKRRIDCIVHHGKVESITLRDPRPIMHAGAAERVDAHAYFGVPDDIHVQDVAEIVHIVFDVVVRVRGGRPPRRAIGCSLDAGRAGREQFIGAVLDPFGDVRICGTAVGRVVLEAAVVGRIVRGRDDDAVGQAGAAAAVVSENRMRDGGRWRVLVIRCDHDFDAIRGEYFERAGERRCRQCVGVEAHEQWSIDALRLAVLADGLAYAKHMRFVEAHLE